ncbi:hypothetical protein F2Q69_00014199 [Brassica cretica]|uniref:Uncharacterized protein n=1 Tax=Brassica cretica TaxID=69181 RepID=A0A8S9R687_BRACR|nr:hypothetical protein F2Q69_00014199 [Brassica cretica]
MNNSDSRFSRRFLRLCGQSREKLGQRVTPPISTNTPRWVSEYRILGRVIAYSGAFLNKKESEKKAILVTFPLENIRSSDDDDSSSGDDDSSSSDDDSRSGDDDSSSGDDDSSSSDDDSSSGGVLIWFSLFITHNYELLYYNVIFLV